ncbi:MAG: glycosyltransferase family 2 protein [Elusimicrobia bacterium]|nr:glycosyltransferase family 2 protein [Elusimicrobiota bacterium]
MRLDSLCISIPAYNEEAALGDVLARSARSAAEASGNWELLVVDDGSQDGTARILEEFGSRCPRLRVVRHEKNLGICESVREVFTLPRSEWVFFVPGDGQIPPEEIHRLLSYTDRYDMVYGWRRDRRDSHVRRLYTRIYNALISLSFGRRVRDVDSVVLFRKSRLEGLRLASRSSFIHAEFLKRALERGLEFIDVPIRHESRRGGVSRGAGFRVMLATALEFLKFNLGLLRA